MDDKLLMNLSPDSEGKYPDIVYRTGSAEVIREPQVVNLSGDIESVGRFIDKRIVNLALDENGELNENEVKKADLHGLQHVDANIAVILVDVEKGEIELLLDPENYYGAKVKGTLSQASELEIFEVNSGDMYSREELIKLIKFNRFLFADEKEQQNLLLAFQKFKADIFLNIHKEDDNRGNFNAVFNRTVNTQVPLTFKLNTPIYKGQPKEKYEVEICINPGATNVQFYFESVELKDLLKVRKEEIIAKQLALCKAFPIINK
ncbi:hypothetical protein [Foetidibacter luteolus]|uniref:hypothetical protein n=1 Tax=Foetidibacter luteolus TaxID=2608880 RepID=UPI00129A30A8|nr:hypothetical protein [Foetidibacter luteolus]